MSFKENLLKKIEIDRLTRNIAAAIGTVESGKRIDKADLQRLIPFFPWTHRRERDLELYLERDGSQKTRILVLDNDLPIYDTTVADVLLRKSPTVKEMVSIRNAIKILNDTDVLVSKKADSLQTIRTLCIDQLDLDYTPDDIAKIAADGTDALESGKDDGVQESLLLFAELLGLVPAPRAFALQHHDIFGKLGQAPAGETTFGPLILFSRVHNTLVYTEGVLRSRDKGRFDRLKALAAGEVEATASGAAVFTLMKSNVLSASFGTEVDAAPHEEAGPRTAQ